MTRSGAGVARAIFTPTLVPRAPGVKSRPPLAEEVRRLRQKTQDALSDTTLRVRVTRWAVRFSRWVSTADGGLAVGAVLGAVVLAVLTWISTTAARPLVPLVARSSFLSFTPALRPVGMSPAVGAKVVEEPSPRATDLGADDLQLVTPSAVIAPAPSLTATLPGEPVWAGPGALATEASTAPALSVGVPSAPRPPVPEGADPAPRRPFLIEDAAVTAPAVVYTAANNDVAPPVLRRQQLSTPPATFVDDPPADWPYLDVLVDESGAVETVRLIARIPAAGETLYRHRMLVAAAKAWQFTPASRDGRPVRYRLRVPLEP
jgi:hypothetical protein